MSLIFEKSKSGRRGFKVLKNDTPLNREFPKKYKRKDLPLLPEVSELDVVRHFTNLSRKNFSVDTSFYPLGSCTMKYNPKFTEDIASLDGFRNLHPLTPDIPGGNSLSQGALEVVYRLEQLFLEITGMKAFTMQPLAGAHGELLGNMLISAYHRSRNEKREFVIVPDSSHGTNPSSSSIAGHKVIVIPTDEKGYMDFGEFKKQLSKNVAAVMLTSPNTAGLFNPKIKEICGLAHSFGSLMYYDGANLNAVLGKVRPGDLGFDVIHLNLHKTFSTPHGGGGPGSGPVGVRGKLAGFLPSPKVVMFKDGSFGLSYPEKSIGKVSPFYGNYAVLLKAYAYILFLGKEGLIDVSEKAVLNANYIRKKLSKAYKIGYNHTCMHECVFSASEQVKQGIHAIDIAKYLIDKGIHPPTVYFPSIVREALMIEPTETESKDTIDYFIKVMLEIAELSKSNPQILKDSPVTTPVRRLDEAKAARELNLRA